MTLPNDPQGVFNPANNPLAVFIAAGNNNRLSTLHLLEFHMQVLAKLGLVSYFEGPGPNPMVNSGAATNKIWLRQGTGVQDTPGNFRVWDRSGDATLEASWTVMSDDIDKYRQHLRLGRSLTVAQASATTWTINHNFQARPMVQCWTSDWTDTIEGAISHPTINQTVITHLSAIAGNVILSLSAEDAPGALTTTASTSLI